MRLALGLGFALLTACGGEAVKAPVPHDSLLSRVPNHPAYPSPATFRYHPRQRPVVNTERRLPDGRILLIAAGGDRWLFDPRTRALTVGPGPAPETLIGVIEHAGDYDFVGASGTSYEAREPLGKFRRSIAPLEPLARASASGRSILGIRLDGSLTRSTDGATSFTHVGPAGVLFADIALSDGGIGLALAIPEALWLTRDEGATWAPFPEKTRGTLALARSPSGQLETKTVFGAYHFVDRPARLEPGPAEAAMNLAKSELPRGPNAFALAAGSAVFIGDRYLEVSAAPEHPSDYQLYQGALDGSLKGQPEPMLKDCRQVRIAGFANYVELACFVGDPAAGILPVHFFRSEDGGKHFQPEPFSAVGNKIRFHFAVGQAGRLVASGLCAVPSAGCGTQGLVLVRRPRPRDEASAKPQTIRAQEAPFELFPAATPSLAKDVLALTFSFDGRTAYVIARSTKSTGLALFVSHDGGEYFEASELNLTQPDDENNDSPGFEEIDSLGAAKDGTLAIVVADSRGKSLLTVDEQGHLLSSAKPPDESALISSVGARAFALTISSRKFWESLDGGVSWQPLGRLPAALFAKVDANEMKLVCAPLGCVIGAELSRIGWGGQAEEGLELPNPVAEPNAFSERKLRTPLSCSLGDAHFQTLPGVRELPSASFAAKGKSAFVALGTAVEHAAAWTVHGVGGPHPHLETVQLLAPLRDNARGYAMQALPQIEGGAALRFRLGSDTTISRQLRDVEVAWDNSLTGQVGHARLSDGGALSSEDYDEGDGPVGRAAPALLSIAEGGLYLRLHHSAGDRQETLYFDGHTMARIPPVQWPVSTFRGRSEMVHSEKTHVPLMFFKEGAIVARARFDGKDALFDAQTLALPAPEQQAQSLNERVSYLGTQAGMQIEAASVTGQNARSLFFPFRARGTVTGAPIRVPTQANLADIPRACTEHDIESTPRVETGYLPGTRHPLVVTDASDAPRLFLSSDALLYGTPEDPCAAAFDAEEVVMNGIPSRHERVLILLQDLAHAWLFRETRDETGGVQSEQYRTLNCHFDPHIEVPAEVYQADGTSAPSGG